MSHFQRKFKNDVPKDFSKDTMKTIERIENCHQVVGVLFLRAGALQLYTLPEVIAQRLVTTLPPLNVAMHQAVIELDVQNELVAYRIEANSFEMTIIAQQEFCACVVHKLNRKKRKHKKPQLHEKN